MNAANFSDQPPSTLAMRVFQRATRYLGVLLLIGIGVIHLYEYSADHYNAIPVIGTLFALNFAAAVVLAVLIAAPIERLPRIGPALLRLLVLAAIGFAATTIAALLISESSTLFGFHEQGYRTTITLSLVFEAGAIVVFGLYGALAYRTARARAASGRGRERARRRGLAVSEPGA